jgi:hypothetical protein
MLVVVAMVSVVPVSERSSAPMVIELEPLALARASMSVAPLEIRLVPLNSAFSTMVEIWIYPTPWSVTISP